ncbi:MAG: TRAP transporter small permease subunit [Rhodospirillales bacterium]
MTALRLLLIVVDGLTALVGRVFGGLVLAMVVLTFTNVLLRFLFGVSFVMLYEANLYAFGMVITACAAWALLRDEHVRVDVFYRLASPRRKAAIDLFGVCCFMAPLLWLIWYRGLPYVERSWMLQEGSQAASGIPGIYILKTFILLFAASLALQGLSMAIKAIAVLAGRPLRADASGAGKSQSDAAQP